ncbi:MAG: hypothetical protein JW894_04390 [Bacteroidales bacterium]|nr:hypothetical protein [Bacteroidales bacterium]
MKIKSLFPLLFLFASVYSQYDYKPGFIVKKNGEREKGLINFKSSEFNAKTCQFKKDSSANPVIYLPDDISTYRFIDSKYFVSKKVFIENADINLFLECLISGKSTIYYTQQNSQDYYFIEIEGELHEINNNKFIMVIDGVEYEGWTYQYRGLLKYYFRDCPQVVQKLNNADFSKNTLISLSKEYHEYVCKDEQCIIYEKDISSLRKRIIFGIDFSYGKIKLDFYQGLISMETKNVYQFNVNSQINLDEAGAFNLQFSLGYYFYKNEIINNITSFTSVTVSIPNDIYYKFSILKPAIQIKYKLQFGKIIPFASVGFYPSVFLADKGELYEYNFDDIVPFTSLGFYRIKGHMSMLCGIGEIGFEKRLEPNTLSFSFFYEPVLTRPMISFYTVGIRFGYYFNNLLNIN